MAFQRNVTCDLFYLFIRKSETLQDTPVSSVLFVRNCNSCLKRFIQNFVGVNLFFSHKHVIHHMVDNYYSENQFNSPRYLQFDCPVTSRMRSRLIILAVFILENALCVWPNLGKHSLLVGLHIFSIKTGTRRIILLEELSSVVRLKRRTCNRR